MMRILVTGATGFVGSHVMDVLRSRADPELFALALERDGQADGVQWVQGDLLKDGGRAAIASIRPTHLLHCAWYAQPGAFWTSPLNLDWTAASLTTLRAFVENGGRRAVLLGTCAEYAPTDEPCNERSTPLVPSTLYGTCKHALHIAAAAYAAQCGIELAWARLFFMFGDREPEQRFVPGVARALLQGEPARCTHGRQLRDFMFIEDVADALVALLASDVTGPVNVASGESVRLADVAAEIARITGRSDLLELGALPARADEPPVITADVSRLKDEVGWTQRYSFGDALNKTVQWWSAQMVPAAK